MYSTGEAQHDAAVSTWRVKYEAARKNDGLTEQSGLVWCTGPANELRTTFLLPALFTVTGGDDLRCLLKGRKFAEAITDSGNRCLSTEEERTRRRRNSARKDAVGALSLKEQRGAYHIRTRGK
ncbi:hypothetical protein NDU88_002223 [Pleurodeles waltl]|uniref:Uncharacterized protein n=1 Tax=Pleurodeles waltl TaxID=8319 RepID=A0AAV7LBX4_PLEWA|nr:hypothetical protein NDU88_002223 [Pleurodeles waltl]